ncbi:hypothetical protein [Endozoicomonas sp. SESOKO4]|uniref:DUF6890 family protein n=1 Tax=Endozoicomonas sp. SESOKO4 TaxID=2828745 RepID=UPI00359FE7A1
MARSRNPAGQQGHQRLSAGYHYRDGKVERLAKQIEGNDLERVCLLSRKWFPDRVPDARSMGEALYLEKDHWEKMAQAVANGIGKALKGK